MSASENSDELPDTLRSSRFIKRPPDKEETQTTSTSQSLIRQKGGIVTGPNQTISISEQRRPSFKDAELNSCSSLGSDLQNNSQTSRLTCKKLKKKPSTHNWQLNQLFFTIIIQNDQPTVMLKQQNENTKSMFSFNVFLHIVDQLNNNKVIFSGKLFCV